MTKQTRIWLFAAIVASSILGTGAYVWQATQPAATPPRSSASNASVPPPAPVISTTVALTTVQPAPRLFALNLDQLEQRGYIQVAALTAPNQVTLRAPLRCWRMHFAAGRGICLQEAIGDWLTPMVAVLLFDEKFQPLYTRQVEGYPSRARMSPDGKYAAFTVFINGHSYNDENFSTATYIWEVATGQDLGNLESYAVEREGQIIREIDFNFWGVTFAKASNRFYATLSSGGIPMLVEGDLAARRMTVLREGVECPSLSPDNRRIAFKKARGNGEWQLAVLDLATRQEVLLAEPRSVDDQVEWLDDNTVLYQQLEYDSMQNAWINVLRIPADGSGAPELFANRVNSPAVVY